MITEEAVEGKDTREIDAQGLVPIPEIVTEAVDTIVVTIIAVTDIETEIEIEIGIETETETETEIERRGGEIVKRKRNVLLGMKGAAEGTAAPAETETRREAAEGRSQSHRLTKNRLETGTHTQDHKHPPHDYSFLFVAEQICYIIFPILFV